ncbi:hypothetical protein G6F46_012254 [Rhizopus delemar]|uniref:Uncharacterized protein n=3 Tax=Rhizopus TaxID=4842 RepID=I1CLP4_RHIO9|nr:hypothetical protein RO3G_14085 [Rhizopus delemar RA 99-880]KAG1174309.1 hypothetical protein G6F36_011255 [Rhizopus arrhizus]KAG1450190.1 hypothetical protein G6F55_009803 [Rhizopus delemar]KAG1488549.1 hypothetical protein G6F54_012017 [Rhizopus delemar]KAG1496375.1 hypothetical protein G6F53_012185 [Rhizopus delemar]|eukprot:EIE89374.1 hypothetical protein RO3G_14085 [Rhizopus delemar RA 99-880]
MFDITLSQVQGQPTVHNLPKSAMPEFSDPATSNFPESVTPSHPKVNSASQRNLEPIRTFTTHMNQIIRKDLEPEIKDHFIDVLKNAHVDVSDYVCNYDFKVFNMLLVLLSDEFLMNTNGDIPLQKTTEELIRNVLPFSFTSDCNSNEYILSLSGTSHKARDSVSDLAIEISQASRLTSGTT